MPRSKRARLVHESKVTKKNHREQSESLVSNIQAAVSQYDYLYVFSVDNMRNNYLKDVRTEFSKDGRLFFGKTKVMVVALGATPDSAAGTNTDQLRPYLTGAVGLLFTTRSPTAVTSFFDGFHPADYARAGNVSPRDFTIPAGVVRSSAGELPEADDEPLAHTMEPALRRLGVPTRLVGGVVRLEMHGGYPVCKAGEVLDSRQATLLKMFGIASVEFRVEMRARWDKESGKVTVLEQGGEKKEENGDVEMA